MQVYASLTSVRQYVQDMEYTQAFCGYVLTVFVVLWPWNEVKVTIL